MASRFRVFADRSYHDSAGDALRLDLYAPAPGSPPAPVFVFFHGGGWVTGSKEAVSLHVLPWLDAGWAVANVEYRLAGEAPAPAAAWDARQALRWVIGHADEHGLDRWRVVVGGMSSGAHLALLAGMAADLPRTDGDLDGDSSTGPLASAIVSWFGISDVAALLQGERPRAYARRWVGSHGGALLLAQALSPLRHITPSTPPVISVHGTADPTVPYEQSLRLHETLERSGVPNRLFTVEGGGHGDFSEDVWGSAYRFIFHFLGGVMP